MTTKAAGDKGTESGVNRLIGMVVKEVSIVDRAANECTFLVLKREGGRMSIRKDETAAAPATPGAGAPEAAKLAPMQAQVKDSLVQAITAAAEKLVALGNQVKDVETTEDAATPPVPVSVTGELTELASMLSGLSAQYGGQAAAPAKAEGDKPVDGAAAPPPGQAAAPAKGDLGGITENGGPDAQGEQKRDYAAMAKAIDLAKRFPANGNASILLKAGDVGAFVGGLAVVAKVGRKMAKERLGRFRKAMDMLAGIMKELSNDTMRKRAAPSGFVRVSATDLADIKKSMDEASSKLVAQAQTIRKQADALGAHERGAQTSNAGPQGERPDPAVVRKGVTWPRDMNDARELTPATSFAGASRTAR